MPTETRGIYFGGGGSGVLSYITPAKRKASQDDSLTRRITKYTRIIRQRPDEEEVFIFTIKEPIKSIIIRLMDIFKQINEENQVADIKDINISIVSGPLGYTGIRAFRPIIPTVTQIIFKPVFR